jgi:cytochrome c oxidase subunit 4
MTETHNDEAHHGPSFKAYLIIFGALSIFTAISFLVNEFVGRNLQGLVIILAVAVCKAVLVGIYFMHLIVDWKKLYYLIFPTFILAAMFLTVLMPDMVLVWHSLGAPAPPPAP